MLVMITICCVRQKYSFTGDNTLLTLFGKRRTKRVVMRRPINREAYDGGPGRASGEGNVLFLILANIEKREDKED
jgi:hypothetical protein